MDWAGLSRHDGGYAEYMLVPNERHLISLHKLAPKDAAPLTDAALTPYRAIARALPKITPDYATLVIGAGGLGQFAIKLLRILTASPIIAVDISEDKLALARQLGADHAINSREKDVLPEILQLSPGGVCASFDMVGSDATLTLAASATRKLGRVVQIGLAGGTARLQALSSWQFEVEFTVSLWGSIKELREVLAMADDGRLTPIPLEFYPLEQINDVYHRLEKGLVNGRAVITP